MHARSPRTDSSRSDPTSPSPSPYRSALPTDVEPEEDPLRLRLDFHDETVVLHDYADGVARARVVSALDIAHALARELDLDSGLLPLEALWWAKTAGGTRVAVWREPRVWTVRLRERADAPPRRLRLPMPGLVFVCLPARQAPYVFAAARRPRTLDDRLYRCPTYNVFASAASAPARTPSPPTPGRSPRSSSAPTSRRPATPAAASRGASRTTSAGSGPSSTADRPSHSTTWCRS